MTLVKASIDIDVPQDRVYDTMLDPQRLREWVTIHRRLNRLDGGPPHEGYEMEQTLSLRGANFKVRWTLTHADRPDSATWEGRGPAHSYARTSYRLHARDGGGTRFDYENEFKAPGGFVGAAASRRLISGVSQREATRSLQKLKALLEAER
jgi:carbon monoxide dehydrogenase subunit G